MLEGQIAKTFTLENLERQLAAFYFLLEPEHTPTEFLIFIAHFMMHVRLASPCTPPGGAPLDVLELPVEDVDIPAAAPIAASLKRPLVHVILELPDTDDEQEVDEKEEEQVLEDDDKSDAQLEQQRKRQRIAEAILIA